MDAILTRAERSELVRYFLKVSSLYNRVSELQDARVGASCLTNSQLNTSPIILEERACRSELAEAIRKTADLVARSVDDVAYKLLIWDLSMPDAFKKRLAFGVKAKSVLADVLQYAEKCPEESSRRGGPKNPSAPGAAALTRM